jgi:ubiquinone/menaquinone biosynthesis C-methylase UbiE
MASNPSPSHSRPDGSSAWARKENWDSAAALYDGAVGRYSASAAERLVTVADAARSFTTPGSSAIDLGAGTGSIAHALAARFPELPVLATDVSAGMLEQLRSKGKGQGRADTRITTAIVDMAAPVEGEGGGERRGAFSHALSSFALQALQEPQQGVDGMHALLQPGGVVALAAWAFDEWCGPNEVWRKAALRVDPQWTDPIADRELRTSLPKLKTYLANSGFREVVHSEIWRGRFVAPQGLLGFFFESENPWAKERRATFHGSLDELRTAMQQVLKEDYASDGEEITIDAAIAVAIK